MMLVRVAAGYVYSGDHTERSISMHIQSQSHWYDPFFHIDLYPCSIEYVADYAIVIWYAWESYTDLIAPADTIT